MIWCNTHSKERREKWPWAESPERARVNEAKKWCNRYPSDGRYYYHYTNSRWWFEKEEDAIMFALQGF